MGYSSRMRKAWIFGAGKVGRGFLGHLFSQSGWETGFVDTRRDVIDTLNRNHAYDIEFPDGERIPVAPVKGCALEQTETVIQAIEEADVIATAVGVNSLPTLGAILAQGFVQRARRENAFPLNLLICENDLEANTLLKSAIETALPASHQSLVEQIGFARCVVSRMVFEELPDDPPTPRAERYALLPIDGNALKGSLPPVKGLLAVQPFQAHMERKLFLHNGLHAMLAYEGALKGLTYIHEAMNDPAIRAQVESAANALQRAFLKTGLFEAEEFRAHQQDLLTRFADASYRDPIRRVARDPQRKLRPGDRLLGAAQFLRDHGEDPSAFESAIQAARQYIDTE